MYKYFCTKISIFKEFFNSKSSESHFEKSPESYLNEVILILLRCKKNF